MDERDGCDLTPFGRVAGRVASMTLAELVATTDQEIVEATQWLVHRTIEPAADHGCAGPHHC